MAQHSEQAELGLGNESELLDDLQLQEIFLASLSDTFEDTPERRTEILAEIKSIKTKLKKLRHASQKHTAKPPNVGITSGSGSHSGSLTPSSMMDPGVNLWGNKKRTYSNHLGAAESSLPDAKSRRTTPTPRGSGQASPFGNPGQQDASSVIDLTGDDDEDDDEDDAFLMDRQKEREEAYRRRQEQERRDAELARHLANGVDSDFEFSGPSSSRVSSQPGLSAFDRMLGRSSQSSFESPHPFTHEGGARRLNFEAGTMAGSDHSPVSPPILGRLPSHVKSEMSPSTTRFSHNPAVNQHHDSFTPSFHGSRAPDRPLMPGSFDSDPEDLGDPGPNGSSSQGGTYGRGFSSASSLPGSTTAKLAPGEYARQAALQRQAMLQARNVNSGPSSSSANGLSAYQAGLNSMPGSFPQSNHSTSLSRPGWLAHGSFNPFSAGPLSSHPSLSGSGLGGSLGDIIERTTSFLESGLDGFGNPLPVDLLERYDEFLEDPEETKEQILKLLAHIADDDSFEEEEEDEDGRDEGLKALKCKLLKHQRIALKWMKGMEADEQKKGGLLADDMGLGKTISTLALLLSRNGEQSESSTRKRRLKTTLVVAPVALLRQWEREINTKVKPSRGFNVLNAHAKKADYETMCRYDVVVTSYGKIASEFRRFTEYMKQVNRDNVEVDNKKLTKLCPFLGPHSMFYRVVLDEAQCIKNKSTKVAQGACRLQAEYRWCLTGTPMMNSVDELASLVHFLRIKPYDNFQRFSKEFRCLSARRSWGSQRQAAMTKLQALLKAIMLRRTKSSEIDGKPIIQLPPKTEVVNHVVFSDDENKYYHDLEERSQVTFSKYLKEGTVGKHYSHVLVLLLRLRQACCHPHLHLTDLEYGSNEAPEDVMVDLAQTLEANVVKRIKEIDAFECPICYEPVENPSIMLPCGHDTCPECLVRLIGDAQQRNLQAGVEGTGTRCPECRGPIDAKKIITYEIFKQVFMPEKVRAQNQAQDGEENDDDETASEEDNDDDDDDETASEEDDDSDELDGHGNLKDFIVDDDVDDSDIDEELRKGLQALKSEKISTEKESKKKKKKKSKSKKAKGKEPEKARVIKPHMLAQLRKEAAKNKKAHRDYMRYLEQIWEPSAKVTECKNLIESIQESGEKTIVFSQWTLLLDLLEIPVHHELKLGFRRYDGGMSASARDDAVRAFTDNPDIKVMLVSLKAGNAGLNLTAASRVIIMDPFWNPYIEAQAVDRTYRLGQTREVQVHRLLVRETVEDRIVALQEKKRELVDSALSEDAAKNIGRLSSQDLAYLFGVRPSMAPSRPTQR